MVFIDILLLVPLVFGLIRGLFKGLIHELLSLVALFLGLFLAYTYADEAQALLSQYIDEDGTGVRILAYLLIFGSVLIAAFALSFLLTKLVQAMALGLLNRLLGGIFGLAKALLILLIIIQIFQPMIASSAKWSDNFNKSIVYNKLLNLSTAGKEWLTNHPEHEPENLPNVY